MPSRLMGLRTGGGQVAAFETFLTAPVDIILGFCDSTTWAGCVTKAQGEITANGTSKPYAWSVPLAVSGVSTLAQVAAGAGDATFDALADLFLATRTSPVEPILVRVGWEMFGKFFSWDAEGFEADYIAAFQRCVNRFRAKSIRFKFCFCPTWFQRTSPGNVNVPYGQVWPGDAYVDICGLDTYLITSFDQTSGQTATQVWANKLSAANGMNDLAAFGAAHNKPLALWEWGLDVDNAEGFVDGVANWVRANNVVFQAYFNRDTDATHQDQIDDGTYPASGARVAGQFGAISITSNPNRYAAKDQQVSLTLSASKSVSWSIVSADSSGFSIVGQALVVATSVALGVHSVTIKATDERGLTATQDMSINMQATLPAWSPTVLGSALIDWYDASDASTITHVAGAVSKWTSKVGSGRSADQGTAAAKPTYSAVGHNGLPSLSFDGGDYLTQTTVTNVPAGQAAFTVAGMAYADPALATFRYFSSDADAAGGNSARSIGNGSNAVRMNFTASLSTGQWLGLDHSFVGSAPAGASPTGSLSIDGNAKVTGTLTVAAFTPTRRVIGAQGIASNAVGSFWTGHVQELLYMNREPTASELDQIHGYSCWKWGQQSRLPANHPYKNAAPTITDA
jgi:hypothetical protein